MNYILAFCGLILIILTFPSVLAELLYNTTVNGSEEDKEVSPLLLEYLQSIEDRLGVLADTLAEITRVVDERLINKPVQRQDFTKVLDHAKQNNKPLSVNEQIYQGFINGKSVTELAQEFGRGKGEIELILNLKR